ncbi:NAD(P)H dehydrogenase (quinone) [Pedobacter terrae]|uniref:NAD(P)H dehydrogenase (Quinone) n=1 Tax=Pedobacter terrae TaxID=405671 RepID=A0A1G7WC36_9SPHI|nr:NmrA family NAD(P)-binding protein [Pedobacter terrae]SDG68660.1 NAD(P)H dehydrogenase (quinone) [Pedobacter terrae]
MILVTGATGNLGRATINALLKVGIAAKEIAALVRDEEKGAAFKSNGIQVKVGDYDDFASLTAAFEDVDKLLLISSSSDIIHRFNQHKNVIDAAKKSGVSHIIYTGFDMKNLTQSTMADDVIYHAYTADYLKHAEVPYTLMNNTLYADLIPIIAGENILDNGISIPAGDGHVPFLPIAEMANALASVATTPGHQNQAYTIAAETAISFAEIAEIISALSGKKIAYHQAVSAVYIEQLVKQGISAGDAAYLARFAGAIAEGEFETHKSDIEKILGRPALTLRDYLTTRYLA